MSGKYFYKGVDMDYLFESGSDGSLGSFFNFPRISPSAPEGIYQGVDTMYQGYFLQNGSELLNNYPLKKITISNSGITVMDSGNSLRYVNGDTSLPMWTHFKFRMILPAGNASTGIDHSEATYDFTGSTPYNSRYIDSDDSQYFDANTKLDEENEAGYNQHTRHRRRRVGFGNKRHEEDKYVNLLHNSVHHNYTLHGDNSLINIGPGQVRVSGRTANATNGNGLEFTSNLSNAINIEGDKSIYIRKCTGARESGSSHSASTQSYIYVSKNNELQADGTTLHFPYFFVGGYSGQNVLAPTGGSINYDFTDHNVTTNAITNTWDDGNETTTTTTNDVVMNFVITSGNEGVSGESGYALTKTSEIVDPTLPGINTNYTPPGSNSAEAAFNNAAVVNSVGHYGESDGNWYTSGVSTSTTNIIELFMIYNPSVDTLGYAELSYLPQPEPESEPEPEPEPDSKKVHKMRFTVQSGTPNINQVAFYAYAEEQIQNVIHSITDSTTSSGQGASLVSKDRVDTDSFDYAVGDTFEIALSTDTTSDIYSSGSVIEYDFPSEILGIGFYTETGQSGSTIDTSIRLELFNFNGVKLIDISDASFSGTVDDEGRSFAFRCLSGDLFAGSSSDIDSFPAIFDFKEDFDSRTVELYNPSDLDNDLMEPEPEPEPQPEPEFGGWNEISPDGDSEIVIRYIGLELPGTVVNLSTILVEASLGIDGSTDSNTAGVFKVLSSTAAIGTYVKGLPEDVTYYNNTDEGGEVELFIESSNNVISSGGGSLLIDLNTSAHSQAGFTLDQLVSCLVELSDTQVISGTDYDGLTARLYDVDMDLRFERTYSVSKADEINFIDPTFSLVDDFSGYIVLAFPGFITAMVGTETGYSPPSSVSNYLDNFGPPIDGNIWVPFYIQDDRIDYEPAPEPEPEADPDAYVEPSITVELWGAAGSAGAQTYGGHSQTAYAGGYVRADLKVASGTTLYIYCGTQPVPKTTSLTPNDAYISLMGGWNGGGNGIISGYGTSYASSYAVGSVSAGGGSTDIRLIPGSSLSDWSNATSLNSRIVVAGAAGGTGGVGADSGYLQQKGWGYSPGSGGYPTGGSGYSNSADVRAAGGGTQSAGGVGGQGDWFTASGTSGGFGYGGQGAAAYNFGGAYRGGSGGGGGWYGGGGAGASRSGGGGSSYVDSAYLDGVATYVSSRSFPGPNSSYFPDVGSDGNYNSVNQSFNYSYLTSSPDTGGDGACRITDWNGTVTVFHPSNKGWLTGGYWNYAEYQTYVVPEPNSLAKVTFTAATVNSAKQSITLNVILHSGQYNDTKSIVGEVVVPTQYDIYNETGDYWKTFEIEIYRENQVANDGNSELSVTFEIVPPSGNTNMAYYNLDDYVAIKNISVKRLNDPNDKEKFNNVNFSYPDYDTFFRSYGIYDGLNDSDTSGGPITQFQRFPYTVNNYIENTKLHTNLPLNRNITPDSCEGSFALAPASMNVKENIQKQGDNDGQDGKNASNLLKNYDKFPGKSYALVLSDDCEYQISIELPTQIQSNKTFKIIVMAYFTEDWAGSPGPDTCTLMHARFYSTYVKNKVDETNYSGLFTHNRSQTLYSSSSHTQDGVVQVNRGRWVQYMDIINTDDMTISATGVKGIELYLAYNSVTTAGKIYIGEVKILDPDNVNLIENSRFERGTHIRDIYGGVFDSRQGYGSYVIEEVPNLTISDQTSVMTSGNSSSADGTFTADRTNWKNDGPMTATHALCLQYDQVYQIRHRWFIDGDSAGHSQGQAAGDTYAPYSDTTAGPTEDLGLFTDPTLWHESTQWLEEYYNNGLVWGIDVYFSEDWDGDAVGFFDGQINQHFDRSILSSVFKNNVNKSLSLRHGSREIGLIKGKWHRIYLFMGGNSTTGYGTPQSNNGQGAYHTLFFNRTKGGSTGATKGYVLITNITADWAYGSGGSTWGGRFDSLSHDFSSGHDPARITSASYSTDFGYDSDAVADTEDATIVSLIERDFRRDFIISNETALKITNSSTYSSYNHGGLVQVILQTNTYLGGDLVLNPLGDTSETWTINMKVYLGDDFFPAHSYGTRPLAIKAATAHNATHIVTIYGDHIVPDWNYLTDISSYRNRWIDYTYTTPSSESFANAGIFYITLGGTGGWLHLNNVWTGSMYIKDVVITANNAETILYSGTPPAERVEALGLGQFDNTHNAYWEGTDENEIVNIANHVPPNGVMGTFRSSGNDDHNLIILQGNQSFPEITSGLDTAIPMRWSDYHGGATGTGAGDGNTHDVNYIQYNRGTSPSDMVAEWGMKFDTGSSANWRGYVNSEGTSITGINHELSALVYVSDDFVGRLTLTLVKDDTSYHSTVFLTTNTDENILYKGQWAEYKITVGETSTSLGNYVYYSIGTGGVNITSGFMVVTSISVIGPHGDYYGQKLINRNFDDGHPVAALYGGSNGDQNADLENIFNGISATTKSTHNIVELIYHVPIVLNPNWSYFSDITDETEREKEMRRIGALHPDKRPYRDSLIPANAIRLGVNEITRYGFFANAYGQIYWSGPWAFRLSFLAFYPEDHYYTGDDINTVRLDDTDEYCLTGQITGIYSGTYNHVNTMNKIVRGQWRRYYHWVVGNVSLDNDAPNHFTFVVGPGSVLQDPWTTSIFMTDFKVEGYDAGSNKNGLSLKRDLFIDLGYNYVIGDNSYWPGYADGETTALHSAYKLGGSFDGARYDGGVGNNSGQDENGTWIYYGQYGVGVPNIRDHYTLSGYVHPLPPSTSFHSNSYKFNSIMIERVRENPTYTDGTIATGNGMNAFRFHELQVWVYINNVATNIAINPTNVQGDTSLGPYYAEHGYKAKVTNLQWYMGGAAGTPFAAFNDNSIDYNETGGIYSAGGAYGEGDDWQGHRWQLWFNQEFPINDLIGIVMYQDHDEGTVDRRETMRGCKVSLVNGEYLHPITGLELDDSDMDPLQEVRYEWEEINEARDAFIFEGPKYSDAGTMNITPSNSGISSSSQLALTSWASTSSILNGKKGWEDTTTMSNIYNYNSNVTSRLEFNNDALGIRHYRWMPFTDSNIVDSDSHLRMDQHLTIKFDITDAYTYNVSENTTISNNRYGYRSSDFINSIENFNVRDIINNYTENFSSYTANTYINEIEFFVNNHRIPYYNYGLLHNNTDMQEGLQTNNVEEKWTDLFMDGNRNYDSNSHSRYESESSLELTLYWPILRSQFQAALISHESQQNTGLHGTDAAVRAPNNDYRDTWFRIKDYDGTTIKNFNKHQGYRWIEGINGRLALSESTDFRNSGYSNEDVGYHLEFTYTPSAFVLVRGETFESWTSDYTTNFIPSDQSIGDWSLDTNINLLPYPFVTARDWYNYSDSTDNYSIEAYVGTGQNQTYFNVLLNKTLSVLSLDLRTSPGLYLTAPNAYQSNYAGNTGTSYIPDRDWDDVWVPPENRWIANVVNYGEGFASPLTEIFRGDGTYPSGATNQTISYLLANGVRKNSGYTENNPYSGTTFNRFKMGEDTEYYLEEIWWNQSQELNLKLPTDADLELFASTTDGNDTITAHDVCDLYFDLYNPIGTTSNYVEVTIYFQMLFGNAKLFVLNSLGEYSESAEHNGTMNSYVGSTVRITGGYNRILFRCVNTNSDGNESGTGGTGLVAYGVAATQYESRSSSEWNSGATKNLLVFATGRSFCKWGGYTGHIMDSWGKGWKWKRDHGSYITGVTIPFASTVSNNTTSDALLKWILESEYGSGGKPPAGTLTIPGNISTSSPSYVASDTNGYTSFDAAGNIVVPVISPEASYTYTGTQTTTQTYTATDIFGNVLSASRTIEVIASPPTFSGTTSHYVYSWSQTNVESLAINNVTAVDAAGTPLTVSVHGTHQIDLNYIYLNGWVQVKASDQWGQTSYTYIYIYIRAMRFRADEIQIGPAWHHTGWYMEGGHIVATRYGAGDSHYNQSGNYWVHPEGAVGIYTEMIPYAAETGQWSVDTYGHVDKFDYTVYGGVYSATSYGRSYGSYIKIRRLDPSKHVPWGQYLVVDVYAYSYSSDFNISGWTYIGVTT